jgi:hypothetical protein
MASNYWLIRLVNSNTIAHSARKPMGFIYSLCQELPCILGLVKVKLYKL